MIGNARKLQFRKRLAHQNLSLGTRNQYIRSNQDGYIAKGNLAADKLQWLPPTAAGYEITQNGSLIERKRSLKVHIQLNTTQTRSFRHQPFCRKARIFITLTLKKPYCPIKSCLYGPHIVISHTGHLSLPHGDRMPNLVRSTSVRTTHALIAFAKRMSKRNTQDDMSRT